MLCEEVFDLLVSFVFVLICGEIGIGKELVVWVLYDLLLCFSGVFVVLNCVVLMLEWFEWLWVGILD